MKKVFLCKLIITGLLAFLLGLASCEPSYPDDIPKWLKKKIKEEIEHNMYFDSVVELRSDSAAMPVYQFTTADMNGGYAYYDYYGRQQCYCRIAFKLDTCGNIAYFPSYKKHRIIYVN
jgi:hypothetical protein